MPNRRLNQDKSANMSAFTDRSDLSVASNNTITLRKEQIRVKRRPGDSIGDRLSGRAHLTGFASARNQPEP